MCHSRSYRAAFTRLRRSGSFALREGGTSNNGGELAAARVPGSPLEENSRYYVVKNHNRFYKRIYRDLVYYNPPTGTDGFPASARRDLILMWITLF